MGDASLIIHFRKLSDRQGAIQRQVSRIESKNIWSVEPFVCIFKYGALATTFGTVRELPPCQSYKQ